MQAIAISSKIKYFSTERKSDYKTVAFSSPHLARRGTTHGMQGFALESFASDLSVLSPSLLNLSIAPGKTFLKKIRNIFCILETNFSSEAHCVCACVNGETFRVQTPKSRNVSAIIFLVYGSTIDTLSLALT